MRKGVFIFWVIINICSTQNSYCQKIFSDTKDPFTNTRTISSNLDPLCKVGFGILLQVQTSVRLINDSITSYTLAFITPSAPVVIEIKDSTLKNSCLIKDGSDNIYSGSITSAGTADVLGIKYTSYVCEFSEADFNKLKNQKVTDIKITTNAGNGGLFAIDKSRQGNISKQIEAVLNAIKK